MSYPDGATEPFTNDLMSYVGLDIDDNRDMLVTSRRETRAALWVGDASGTAGAEITASYPHIGIGARVAWAGDRLLYDTLASGVPAIVAVPAQGGPPSEIVQNALFFTATEDAGTIVYMGAGGGLWRSDGSGRQPLALITEEFAPNPLLAPDGRHVIFVAIRDGAQTPSVVPIDGGEITVLARVPTGIGDQTIDVTADGKLLLLTRNDAGEGIFVVCDWPDCSNRRDVRAPTGAQPPVRWTPDGREIAFVDARGTNIWAAAPLDDATPRQITHFNHTTTRRRIAHYAWSGDRARLAIVFMTVTEDVVLIGGLQQR